MLNRILGIGYPPDLSAALHSRQIRVVINALHAKSGGGITYLRNILPLLANDQRMELHIFLHQSQLALFHPIDERVIVHAFDFPPGLARLMGWEQLILPIMVKVMSADVVFSPANFGSLLINRQVILLRNALAVAKTETRWSKRLYWIALGIITFVSLIRARRAIAVSNYAARSLSMGLRNYFRNKIRIVHHGIGPGFHPDSSVPRTDFILAVSDIYVQKNLHTLFHAMQTVFSRHPELKLLIAGQKIDSWYFDRITTLAEKLGISSKVHFIGRQGSTELENLYRQCQVFVFPSTAETFGNPLVEAMACGAPIASSSSAAMPEIVGDAAILFNPLDPDEMATCILNLVENETLRQQLSSNGITRAAQFSWMKAATRTAEVLVEAAGTRP